MTGLVDRLYEEDFVHEVASMAYLMRVDPLALAKAQPYDLAFYGACARVYGDIEKEKAEQAKRKQ